nr:MAG TPA: hypothetical protein [Caudoviricetes sp.]
MKNTTVQSVQPVTIKFFTRFNPRFNRGSVRHPRFSFYR